MTPTYEQLEKVAKAAAAYVAVPHMPLDNLLYDLLEALNEAGIQWGPTPLGCHLCGWAFSGRVYIDGQKWCPVQKEEGPCDETRASSNSSRSR